MLKKIHGTSTHTEISKDDSALKKASENPVSEKEPTELEKLKMSLAEAISSENFEQAAILRDKIRAMEKEGEE